VNTNKLWTRDFVIVSFVNFLISLNFFLLMVSIALYAMDNFDSTPSEAGLAASIFVFGSLIARLFSGRWIERIGRKKTLFIGLTLSLIMTILYFGVNSILLLFVIRFFHGAAFGIASTGTGTVVANIIPKARSGEGIAYYALSSTIAMAVGPFLGLFISYYGNSKMIFIAGVVSAALSIVSAFFLTVPELNLTEEQLQETKGFKLNGFFETKALPISIVCFFFFFSYSSVLTFFSAYAKEVQLVDAASFFFVIISAAIFLSRPITGRLFDLKGENFIMYPAILLYMMGMIILSQASHGYALFLAGSLIGLGFGTIQSSSQTIAIKVTPPHRMGLATSTFFMSLDLATGIGPFIYGLFIPFIGYRGMYVGAAVVLLISMFLYYLLHGRQVGRGHGHRYFAEKPRN